MQPFSITLFAKTGDPEGIRHLEKSNWSGSGVVFTKELFKQLKDEPGFHQAGVYILVGNAAEETIYIGEADPVGERIKAHVAQKEGWDWGVYFFDRHHKIGKTEVQYLESKLLKLARDQGNAILLNKNKPLPPSMSLATKAGVDAFLNDILLIVPMLGINAFTPRRPLAQELTDPSSPQDNVDLSFDTIVVPAREEGFNKRFLGEHCWFAIRINSKHIPKLKYIAAYQVAPVAAITHIAEIDTITPYEDSDKYILTFKKPACPLGPIPRISGSTITMQSPRYALHANLQSAHDLDAVWK